MSYDWVLWAIIACFAAWEICAHFWARNRAAHTLSNRIWALEQRHPVFRVLVGCACAVLFTHLEFQLP